MTEPPEPQTPQGPPDPPRTGPRAGGDDAGVDFGSRLEFYTFHPERLADALPAFRLVREVGQGSMGIVYEARRIADGERVAIKVLPPSLTLTERALARFHREGELMRRIAHPNIVRVLDQGRGGRLSWFVMEFIDGVNLDARLATGPLPIRQVAELGVQVADALHYAHERGIVHRDVKPANLILRDDGRVAITDFGLARETGTGSMTESGAIVGTPMYMAPEQVLGDRAAIDSRADVYGLGATLYTLLAGRAPFEGPTAQSVLKQVLDTRPVRLRRRRADVPPPLEAIVMRAMERDPALRYGTCADLADDLRRFLGGQRPTARLPGPVARLTRTAGEHPMTTTMLAVIVTLATGTLALQNERARSAVDALVADAERALAEANSARDERGSPVAAEVRRSKLYEAVASASGALTRDAGHARAWFVRARAHLLLRNDRDALDDLERAERTAGRATPEILLYRIEAASRLHDDLARDKLRRDLFALLDVSPGPHSRCIVAGHLLDMARRAPADERQPILDSVARIIAPIDGDGPHVAVVRARLAELDGDPDRAIAVMRAAVAAFPGDLVVQTEAAAMFRRLGLDDDSATAAELARVIDPSFAPAADPRGEDAAVDVDAMRGFLDNLRDLVHGLDRRR